MALNAHARPDWDTADDEMLTGTGTACEAASSVTPACGHSTSSVNVRCPPGHAHTVSPPPRGGLSSVVAAVKVTLSPALGSPASKRLTTGGASPSAAHRDATEAEAGSTRSALHVLPHTRGSPEGVQDAGHASRARGSPTVHAGGGEEGVKASASWQTCDRRPREVSEKAAWEVLPAAAHLVEEPAGLTASLASVTRGGDVARHVRP